MKSKRSMRWSDIGNNRKKRMRVESEGRGGEKPKKLSSECVKVVSFNADGWSEMSENDTRELARTQKPGLIGILETKLRQEDGSRNVEIPEYDVVDVRRSDLAGDKEGGGILVYSKQAGNVKYRERTFKIRKKEHRHVQTERVWMVAKTGKSKWAFGFVYIAQQKKNDEFGEWNNSIYQVLSEEMAKLKSEGYKIYLAGDFNGWVGAGKGGVPGNDVRINQNGERLLSFIESNGMKMLNGTACCTGIFSRHGHNSATLLDYVCVTDEDQKLVKKMVVDEYGVYGGASDHVYVISTVDVGGWVEPPVRAKTAQAVVWDFTGKTDWGEFKKNMDDSIRDLKQEELENMDVFGERMTGVAMKALEEVVGRRKPGLGMKPKVYPSKVRRVMEAVRLATRAWREALTVAVREPSRSNKEIVARKEVIKSNLKERLENMLGTFWQKKRSEVLEELSVKSVEATKKFWRHVVNKNMKPTSFVQVESVDTEEMVTDQQEVKEEVEKFLKNLFLGEFEKCEEEGGMEEGQEEELETSGDLVKEFTMEEVMLGIGSLKNDKAMGIDNVPAEVLKNGSVLFVKTLTELFNKVLKEGTVPEVWKTGRVVMVHKAGARSDLANYRPLTVICTMSALFSRLLTARLTKEVEEKNILGEVQQGFRKGRCGADNNFVLHTILQKCTAQGKKPHMAFIDIKKVWWCIV